MKRVAENLKSKRKSRYDVDGFDFVLQDATPKKRPSRYDVAGNDDKLVVTDLESKKQKTLPSIGSVIPGK